MQWVSRAKEVVDSYRDSGRDIYLAGFSMGGVIASYLAVVCPVKRLLLLAPAFSYMNVDIITGVLTKSASSLMGNEKKEEIQLPRAFYGAFTELVKNLKKYIGFVECPVFIIHGNADEVISVKSSLWAYNKIPHSRKKLILLHDGHHRLLMDPEVSWTCYQNMKLFFEGVLLPDNEPVMAEDIMGALLEEKAESVKAITGVGVELCRRLMNRSIPIAVKQMPVRKYSFLHGFHQQTLHDIHFITIPKRFPLRK